MAPKLSLADRFWSKVDRQGSKCWPWLGVRNRAGYGVFFVGGKARNQNQMALAHRVAFSLAKRKHPRTDLCVLHRCDNPPCVNPAHLFSGSHADNVADKVEKGRQSCGDQSGPRKHPEKLPRGEAHWKTSLTAEQVQVIRKRSESGTETQMQIAASFGISNKTVSQIVRRARWGHI